MKKSELKQLIKEVLSEQEEMILPSSRSAKVNDWIDQIESIRFDVMHSRSGNPNYELMREIGKTLSTVRELMEQLKGK